MTKVYETLLEDRFGLTSNFIDCFTVLKRYPLHNNQQFSTETYDLFRADPHFYGKVWFDWCDVKWEGYTEPYPSRIFMFIDPAKMEFSTDNVEVSLGRFWAVVKSCTDDNRHTSNANRPRLQTPYERYLSTNDELKCYKTENTIRVLDCTSIVKSLFINPNISSDTQAQRRRNDMGINNQQTKFTVKHVMKLPPYEEWSRLFITKVGRDN